MTAFRTRTPFAALLALALLPAGALAQPSFDPLYADHAVLQRDRPLVVIGRAAPNERVTVTLGDHARAEATTDAGGRWRATLPAQPAGGPYLLRATSVAGEASARDVLVGDVWLCSGQSNMEFPLSRAADAAAATLRAADDGLRLLSVPHSGAPTPASAFGTPVAWRAATPESVPAFSAVCYHMVRMLRETRKVPIGAIDASWGGTQIRAWLDPAGSRAIYGAGEAALLARFATDPTGAAVGFAPRWEGWWRTESGDKAGEEPWRAPDRLAWKAVPAIAYWEGWPDAGLAGFDGLLWFRKTVRLTAAQAKQGATLSLGVLDELDQSWVNGKPVGNSFGWDYARRYTLPAGTLRAGDNEIIVALTDTYGNGGMQGPADALSLDFADGSRLALGEGWRYSVSPVKAPPPRAPWDANAGLGLIHNGMIAPMGAYGLAGAAWYQGESDVNIDGYADRLAALFKGWRAQFERPDLPVLVVSLPDYGPVATAPVESGWAALREEQRKAVAADAHAALAVTLDLGDRDDLHPPAKKAVGERLARAADALARSVPAAGGPEIMDAVRAPDGIRLRFRGVSGALHSWSDSHVLGVELCGQAPQSCRYARATPAGDALRIADDGQPATRVRYAWADSPIVNLYDETPLPVGTFEVPIKP